MTESPIENYLDELLRRTRADARATRRLLDEAGDHLYAAAAELQAGGSSRPDAETEAVRRFGPVAPIVRTTFRRSFLDLVAETSRAAVFLLGCGLVAIGASGLVALVMNVAVGRSFVGGHNALAGQGSSVQEAADDAVILRVLAGVLGLAILLASAVLRRRTSRPPVLPAGLVDALGATAFAAGTVCLAAAAGDQAAHEGTSGVGFWVSGALVSLPACVYFCARATRAMLPTGSPSPQ